MRKKRRMWDGRLLRSGKQPPREESDVINGSLQEAGTEDGQESGSKRELGRQNRGETEELPRHRQNKEEDGNRSAVSPRKSGIEERPFMIAPRNWEWNEQNKTSTKGMTTD